MKILCIFGGRGGNSRWCRKTLKTQETKHFIDWNDIFLGQKGLKYFKQNGTPNCGALKVLKALYPSQFLLFKWTCEIHLITIVSISPSSHEGQWKGYISLSDQIIWFLLPPYYLLMRASISLYIIPQWTITNHHCLKIQNYWTMKWRTTHICYLGNNVGRDEKNMLNAILEINSDTTHSAKFRSVYKNH